MRGHHQQLAWIGRTGVAICIKIDEFCIKIDDLNANVQDLRPGAAAILQRRLSSGAFFYVEMKILQ